MSIHPFSSGSQHGDWRASNCDRCTKYTHNPNESKCEIDKAILKAQFGNGTVSDEIAKRMGYYDNNGKDGFSYVWMCNEVECSCGALVDKVSGLCTKCWNTKERR